LMLDNSHHASMPLGPDKECYVDFVNMLYNKYL
jgi:hypothetical protein